MLYNINLEDIMLNERSQVRNKKDKYSMTPLVGGTKSSRIQRHKVEWQWPELVFNWCGVWVLQQEKNLGMTGGDGHTAL